MSIQHAGLNTDEKIFSSWATSGAWWDFILCSMFCVDNVSHIYLLFKMTLHGKVSVENAIEICISLHKEADVLRLIQSAWRQNMLTLNTQIYLRYLGSVYSSRQMKYNIYWLFLYDGTVYWNAIHSNSAYSTEIAQYIGPEKKIWSRNFFINMAHNIWF